MTKEQKAALHEQDLQRLQEFRLMDDDFLSAFFRDNIEDTELSILKPGQKPEELPDTFVIFITESDVIGRDKPIYIIEKHICVDGECIKVDDGAHIIYVNGAKQGSETELEKLMHDFHCTKADDMYFSQLAKKMRYYKEEEKGVEIMCRIMETMRDETELATKIRFALNLINENKFSVEDIARLSELSAEKVRELAEGRSA